MSVDPTPASTPEIRFREVFDQAPISMQLVAADGRTLQVNKAWEAMWQGSLGDALKEYVLHGGYNLLNDPQLEAKGVTPYLRRAFAGEAVNVPAIRYDPAEMGIVARPRWVTSRAQPIKDAQGRVAEVMLMHEDITDRVVADESLRLSEQRYRSLVTASSQIIWNSDSTGMIIDDSPSWRRFTGQTYDQWKGVGWLDAIHPDDRERAATIWSSAIANKALYQTEYRVMHADGEYRWTSVRAVPLHHEDGAIREWIGTNTDITEAKIAESELARRLQAERRHSAVLAKVAAASNQLHSAVTVDDIARDLVGIVRDILGVHQAVISLNTGDNWAQAINAVSLSDKYAGYAGYKAPTDGTGIYATVCRTNQAMRLTQDELERHPDWKGFGAHHRQHPLMRGWLAVPLKAHDGSNIGLLQASDKEDGEFTEEDEAILSQLASIAAAGFENARLYDTLQEQHRRKDEFLAMLAHELRNPMAPIRAAADLLSIANLGEDRIRQTSAVISRQVQHMSSLVDDLLDISRVTRGLIELAGTDLDITRVVADAVEQVRPLVEARQHALTVTSSADSAHVMGDHKRMVQILVNILNNAVKYTQRGGRILVRTETTDGEVIISVEDNGAGMPAELQPYVFDLFSQAHRSSDRAQGGLGIGLALVKSLVGLHGGQVTCRSDGPGTGSRFTVTLPRLKSDAIAGAGQDGRQLPVAPPCRLRILVVDDNVDAARMLAMYLEAAGHEVMVEHTARTGLQRALRDKPAVCILDIGLPDMDGNELARSLRQHPDMAAALLVAATGYGSDRDRENALAAGFDHHLVKPIDSALLCRLLAAPRAI